MTRWMALSLLVLATPAWAESSFAVPRPLQIEAIQSAWEAAGATTPLTFAHHAVVVDEGLTEAERRLLGELVDVYTVAPHG